MKKILDAFSKLVEIICVIFMCLMVIVIFLATLGRYSGWFSIPWSEEFARYCMLGIVYLGLMLASRAGSHFVVELNKLIFPKSVLKVLYVIVTIIVDIFALFIAKYGWAVSSKMLHQGKLSPMLELPLGTVYLLIPIGVVLMAIFYTIYTFEHITSKEENK